jgi:hypothetical protein
MSRTRKDSQGRIWTYNDSLGSWEHGDHVVGCGRDNGSKWQIWYGPSKGNYEFKTLAMAMSYCG